MRQLAEATARSRPHITRFAGRWVCGLRYKTGLAWPIGEGPTWLAALASWRYALEYHAVFPMASLRQARHSLAWLEDPTNALIREFVRDRIYERYPCLK